jgi:hypothetical protein
MKKERYGAWFDDAKRLRTLLGALAALSLLIAESAEGRSEQASAPNRPSSAFQRHEDLLRHDGQLPDG